MKANISLSDSNHDDHREMMRATAQFHLEEASAFVVLTRCDDAINIKVFGAPDEIEYMVNELLAQINSIESDDSD